MRMTNGKYIVLIGIVHTVATLLPSVFGPQFHRFSKRYFFSIDPGFLGLASAAAPNYETFAAFWCFCWGLLLFPLGLLLDHVEATQGRIPPRFLLSYVVVVLVGVYMIPAGGLTLFLLPHAILMLARRRSRE